MIRFPLPSLLSNDESCSLKTHFVKGRRDKKTMKINKNQPVLSQSTAVLNFPTFISQGCNCRTAAAPNPCSKSWVERGSLGAALKQKWYFSFMLLRRDAMLSPPQGQRREVTSSPPWLFLAGHQLLPWFWDMEEQNLEQQVMSNWRLINLLVLYFVLLL